MDIAKHQTYLQICIIQIWLIIVRRHVFHYELASLVSQYIYIYIYSSSEHVILTTRIRTSSSASDEIAVSCETVE